MFASEDDRERFIRATERWNPPDCPRFHYPEDIRREFRQVMLTGRWWGWLPCWAQPLRDFAAEVGVIARASRRDPVEFAKGLIEASGSRETSPLVDWFQDFDPPVVRWEVVQAVESWVFYDLRPVLQGFISTEFDCVVN